MKYLCYRLSQSKLSRHCCYVLLQSHLTISHLLPPSKCDQLMHTQSQIMMIYYGLRIAVLYLLQERKASFSMGNGILF